MRYLVTLLFLSACFMPAKRGTTPREIAAAEYAASVSLMSSCGLTGSGVVLREGVVLTAAHVVRCKPDGLVAPMVAVRHGGSVLIGTVLRWDFERDLALIAVGVQGKALRLGVKPQLADSLCFTHSIPIVGRTCGELWPKWTEVRKSGDLRFSARVDLGNSGSPLWDRSGALVGVVTHAMVCVVGGSCGGAATWLAPDDLFLK